MKICQTCGLRFEDIYKFCNRCGGALVESQAGGSIAGDNNAGGNNAGFSNAGYNNAGYNNAGYNNTGYSNTGYNNAGGNNAGTSAMGAFGAGAAAAPAPPKVHERKAPPKKMLLIAVPLVVLALLAVAAIIVIPMLADHDNNGAMVMNSIQLFYVQDEGITVVSGNNNKKFTIDGILDVYHVYRQDVSLDGSKMVLLTRESDEESNSLWFITTTGSVKIADDVFDYKIANSGNGVIYITDYDSDNSVATLTLYNTSTKKAKVLTDTLYCDIGRRKDSGEVNACISPDGMSAAYVTEYDEETGRTTSFLYIDGKEEKLVDNTYVKAISDGGKLIYYIKTAKNGVSSLYVRSKNNDCKLVSDISDLYDPMFFTADYSEVIFTSEHEDKAYISQNGNEKVELCDYCFEDIILPKWVNKRYDYDQLDYFYSVICGIDSFANNNMTGYHDSWLYYINNKLEVNAVSDAGLGDVCVSYDRKFLYISDNDTLFLIGNANDAIEVDICKNVDIYTTVGDGKSVYYVNDDGELYFAREKEKPVKIADDVSTRGVWNGDYEESALASSGTSTRVYFIAGYSDENGGTLYYSDNGGKKVKVSGADEVDWVYATAVNVFYRAKEGGLYRSNGSDKFELFCRG